MITLRNLTTQSKLFAATICGSAVLAFTALSADVATAQDEPERLNENMEQQDAPNAQEETALDEDETRNMSTTLDLSQISFEANIVKSLGGGQALIVERSGTEFLVPSQAVQSNFSMEGGRPDNESDLTTGTVTRNQSDDLNNESDPTTETMAQNQSDDPEFQEDTQSNESPQWNQGDRVTVNPSMTEADLVALENNVLTVKGDGTVIQLPADLVSNQDSASMMLSVTIDGEKQQMSLADAIDQDRELTLSQEWPTQLPGDAEAGVLVATEPNRLIVATIGENTVQLVQIPQQMKAGQAVSLERDDDRVEVGLLEDETRVSFEETELNGVLLSSNDEQMVLESGENLIILPSALKPEQNLEKGAEVTVTLPAGEALMMDDGEDMAYMELEQGVAHLPKSVLKMEKENNAG